MTESRPLLANATGENEQPTAPEAPHRDERLQPFTPEKPDFLVAGNVRVYTTVKASSPEEALRIANRGVGLDSPLHWATYEGKQVCSEVGELELVDD